MAVDLLIVVHVVTERGTCRTARVKLLYDTYHLFFKFYRHSFQYVILRLYKATCIQIVEKRTAYLPMVFSHLTTREYKK